MTSPSGRNFHLKTEGQKWHVPFCPIFLTCCCETCWGNIFCSSNYWKGQQPRGCSKLNVLSKPSMSIPSAPQVHTKYLWHSCCQLRIFWTHWAIFEFTAVYDAKRNRTEEVNKTKSPKWGWITITRQRLGRSQREWYRWKALDFPWITGGLRFDKIFRFAQK